MSPIFMPDELCCTYADRRTATMTTSCPDWTRFLSHVVETPEGCWLWQRSKTHDGYGKFSVNGRSMLAHRYAYTQTVGPIPPGLVLDHFACDTRACANPTHVRPVTNRENILRGDTSAAKNLSRTECPEGHPFDEDNTAYCGRGRICRICMRDRNRERQRLCRQRRKAAAL